MDISNQRNYSRVDHLLMGVSRAMEACAVAPRAARPFPATSPDDQALSDQERRRSGRYMRVNHVGEVCAQALYHSQALTARERRIGERMKQAAAEENDHLAWCEQRIEELGARTSLLNPLWYLGAFTIGGMAGMAGDKWSLGFVAETERQVVEHLENHLGKLPEKDARSRELVAQMKKDEQAHAQAALEAGAAKLPQPVVRLMQLAAKTMTTTAHWI